MATYPFRNRLIAQHKATRYYTEHVDGVVSDLLAPTTPGRKMGFSNVPAAPFLVESWQDRGIAMASGSSLQYDWSTERPKLNEVAVVMKLGINPAALAGADLVRDLACFSPVQGETVKGAYVVTAVQEMATGRLKLLGQAYDGAGWVSSEIHDFGPVSAGDLKTVYILAVKGVYQSQATVYVYIPGAIDTRLPEVGGAMELIQIGGSDYMAGNEPVIGLPPVNGKSLPMSFFFNAAVPVMPWPDQWFALGMVDQRGWTSEERATIWPADNSSAVIGAAIKAGAPFAVIPITPGSALLAPGPYDRSLATLVDPADPSIREVVQVMAVDTLEGTTTIVRPTPELAWPAGALIKGLLRNENSLPNRSGRSYIFPAQSPTPVENTESEFIVSSGAYLDLAGATWELKFPNVRRFMISKVGLSSGPALTPGTVSIGVPGNPTSVLDALATPALAGNTTWFSTAAFDTTTGNYSLIVTLAGGTGQAKVYLKGVFDPQ